MLTFELSLWEKGTTNIALAEEGAFCCLTDNQGFLPCILLSLPRTVYGSLVSLNVYLVSIAGTNMDFTIKCLVCISLEDASFCCDLLVLLRSLCQSKSTTFSYIHIYT